MTLLLAARTRVLTLTEQRVLIPSLPQLAQSSMITPLDLAPIIERNPSLAHPVFVALLSSSAGAGRAFLEILPYLPPTLTTFDLMGRLLRDHTPIRSGPLYDGSEETSTTITELVRAEVLGRFIHESINFVERAEQEEKEGVSSEAEDRYVKGVQNVSSVLSVLHSRSFLTFRLHSSAVFTPRSWYTPWSTPIRQR